MESKIEDAAKIAIDFTFAVASISKELITAMTKEETIFVNKRGREINQDGDSAKPTFFNSLRNVVNNMLK